jgi:hypothetical protein
MPASFDLMGVSDQPLIVLIVWSSLLGLILILPGSMAAAAGALRALGRRLNDGPNPARHRIAGLKMPSPGHRLVPRG